MGTHLAAVQPGCFRAAVTRHTDPGCRNRRTFVSLSGGSSFRDGQFGILLKRLVQQLASPLLIPQLAVGHPEVKLAGGVRLARYGLFQASGGGRVGALLVEDPAERVLG